MKLGSCLTFVLAIALYLAFTSATAAVAQGEEHGETQTTLPAPENRPSALRGVNRFLAKWHPMPLTCDRNPRVCRSTGSRGPDCCKRQCVNVETDQSNCGLCGKRCRYSEACCGGACVNLRFDERHCGRCGNSCGAGVACSYGLCDYA